MFFVIENVRDIKFKQQGKGKVDKKNKGKSRLVAEGYTHVEDQNDLKSSSIHHISIFAKFEFLQNIVINNNQL